jgi:CRP/FNR family transcriptional regulator, anaerobic regulatory protein
MGKNRLHYKQIMDAWKGPPQCRDCGIRELVLFADLREADFSLIHLPIDEVRFEAGQALYHAGDVKPYVYTVREGVVKLVQYLPDGAHRIVRLNRQGSVLGMEVLVDESYAHTATALQSVLTCRIPRAVIDRLSGETPRLHAQLMKRWHQSLQQADTWLTELSTGSARLRLARLLLQLISTGDSDVCHLPIREDIGAMLAVTMETASRTVAEFRRAGLIAEVGDHLVQCNRSGLEAVVLDG